MPKKAQPNLLDFDDDLDALRAEIESFLQTIKKSKLKLATIEKDINRLKDKPKGHMMLIETYMPKVPEARIQEMLDLLMRLWNALPNPDSGQSPNELVRQERSKPQRRTTVPDWLPLMPLLEQLKEDFLAQFCPSLETLSKRKQAQALAGVHALFFRYYHTCHPELLDNPPFLALEQESEGYWGKLPRFERVRMRVFHNPELPNDPRYYIRTQYGLSDLDDESLYKDLCNGEVDRYWDDDVYMNALQAAEQHFGTQQKPPTPQQLASWLWERSLERWYAADTLLQTCFSLRAWKLFWQAQWAADNLEDGWLVVDQLFSDVCSRLPKNDPDIALNLFQLSLSPEVDDEASLARLDQSFDDPREMGGMIAMMEFGIHMFIHWLVPCAVYMSLVEPIYQDEIDVAAETADFAHEKMRFAEHVAKPPALIRLTPLGEQALSLGESPKG